MMNYTINKFKYFEKKIKIPLTSSQQIKSS